MKRFLGLVAVLMCCVVLATDEGRIDPLNAVVKVETTSTVPNFWLPWQSQLPQSGSGSGAVIKGGMILTNAHNVADSSLISVRKQNDDTLFVAKVKFVDHDCDLALLTVDDPKFFAGITPLEFAETPPPQSQVGAAGLRRRSTRRSTPATRAGRSYSTARSSASLFRITPTAKIWAT